MMPIAEAEHFLVGPEVGGFGPFVLTFFPSFDQVTCFTSSASSFIAKWHDSSMVSPASA